MQKINLLFYIAFRYIKSRNHKYFPSITSSLSMIGIGIGVATLIIVMSVMNGFRQQFMENILGINSHLTLTKFGLEKIIDFDKISSNVKAKKGVIYAIPNIEGQAIISGNEKIAGASIKGMSLDDFAYYDLIQNNLEKSSKCQNLFKSDNGNDGIVIGRQILYNLGLKIGDSLSLIGSQGNTTIFGSIPRYKTYTICGSFSIGMMQYDGGLAFISLESAQKFFRYKNAVSAIDIFINPSEMENVKIQLLRDESMADLNINDWEQNNSSIMHALKVESTVMFFILSLFMLVAIFSIIANLTMMINDKKTNISVMRSMGFSIKEIISTFFISGMIIGFVGLLIGNLLGLLIANNIENIRLFLESCFNTKLLDGMVYFLSILPSRVMISDVITVNLMAIFFILLSSILPARKIAKYNVSTILRGN